MFAMFKSSVEWRWNAIPAIKRERKHMWCNWTLYKSNQSTIKFSINAPIIGSLVTLICASQLKECLESNLKCPLSWN